MPQFFDPDDPLGLKKLLGGGVATLAPAPSTNGVYRGDPNSGVGIDTVRPPVATFDPAYNAATNQFGAQQNAIDARQGVITATRGVQPFTMATLNANRGVLGARQQTFGPQQGVINANRGVQGAQGVQIQGQRGLIGQQQNEVATQRGEYEAQVNAQNNVPDQQAVATFKRYQAAKDSRNRALGITPDQEIDVPVGFTGALGPGVRARATTQAEDVARTNKESQTRRGFDLESAKLAVQLMGSDVDQARLVAAQAGLTLDEAQLGVQQAENAAGYARLDESQAGIGVDNARLNSEEASLGSTQADLDARMANRPPFPGAEKYTDPYTGQSSWMTPSEADNLKYQYENDLTNLRIPSQYNTSQNRQQYNTAQDAQGSALAPYSTEQLLSQYNAISPPGAKVTPQMIKAELARRLMLKGYPVAVAESAAQQLIDAEMQKRRDDAAEAAKKKASGTPTLSVDANGKIVVKP